MPPSTSGPQELRLVLRDLAQATRAYDNGLRMGMVTFQPDRPPDEGTTCRVLIELPFAGQRHTLRGKVVHASPVATVVQLRKVPEALHSLAGGGEAEPSGEAKLPALVEEPPRPGEPGRFVEEGVLVSETPGAVLLRQLHLERCGVLVIDSKPHRYSVTLIDGAPAHVLREPELPSATTEAVLARRKLLAPAMVDRVRWLTRVTEQPMLSVVMSLGLITLEQFAELRDEQLRALLKRVLAVEGGSYRMYEADEIRMVFPAPTLDTVPAVWRLALKNVRRMTPAASATRIHALHDEIPIWTEVGKAQKDRLPLAGEEQVVVLQELDGVRPLGEILEDSTQDARMGGELMLTLHSLGLIDFRPPDASGAPSIDEDAWRDQIDRLAQDHFTFLGLHWTALPRELVRACDELELDLPIGDPEADPIRKRIGEIRDMASDKGWRRAYRKEIVGESERVAAAETFLEQGEMALFRKDLAVAEEHFERAREVEPGGAGSLERRERVKEALRQFHEGGDP